MYMCVLVSTISHASPAWKLQPRVTHEPLLLTKTERAANANIWGKGLEIVMRTCKHACTVISSDGRIREGQTALPTILCRLVVSK